VLPAIAPRACLALAALVAISSLTGAAATPVAPGAPHGDPEPRVLGLAHFRNVVRALREFQGRLWVATYGAGLHAVGPGGVQTYTRANSPLLEDRINVLGEHAGELWIGTCAGFSIHDGMRWRKQTRRDGIADDVYHAVAFDGPGRAWVGTAGSGLSVLSGGRWRTLGASDGLTDSWINDILCAPDGQTWVAGGVRVFRSEGERFREERPPWARMPAAPTSLALRGSEVWVGSAFSGLTMYQGGRWYRPPSSWVLPSPQVNALAVDGRHRLWVGTAGGIVAYAPERGWRRYGPLEGLVETNIRALHYAAGSGTLWAGSFVGGWVYRYDPESDRFERILHAGQSVRDVSDLLRQRRR
jgi:ligand-binding sensor domain-containing protein